MYTINLKTYAKAALETFDLTQLQNINRNQAIGSLESELSEQQGLNNIEVTEQRHEYFKVPGAQPEHYKELEFDLQDKKKTIAGIRHIGGDVERPFVAIWPDYKLENLEELKEVYSVVKSSFEVFKPNYINFWQDPKSNFSIELSKSVMPSQRYVAAYTSDIKSKKLPNHYDLIKLLPVTDNTYRKWYEILYAQFHGENKDLKDWVPMNDEEDMNSCLEDGLLYYVEIDGQRAGIIGATNDNLLGLSGVYFNEILLSREFKGKGFAPAVQRKFIDKINSEIEVVWGTIDARNKPSTKTALRVGRCSIRNEYFFPVSEL